MSEPPPPTIGADIGGTNLRVAAVDPEGGVLDEARVATPDRFDAVVDVLADLAAGLARRHRATAFGAGVAGMVDTGGVVHYAPNLPQLRDAPLAAALATHTGLRVVVDNDANAAALGEQRHGAARGARHALVVTLGTGIGGGLILDGCLYRGAHGFAAEIGHWPFRPDGAPCACGERGHWEAEASGTALGRLGRDRAEAGAAPGLARRAGGDAARVTGLMVGDAAREGDADALAILDEYAMLVARGLAGLVNILDPELVVVSGGLVGLGELLLAPMRAEMALRIEGAGARPAVPIVAAALGERAGVVGAAELARDGDREGAIR